MSARVPAAVTALLAVVALAGCGGGGSVDSGGFTAHDRASAQQSLDLIQRSAVPAALLRLSRAADYPPAACFVHALGTNPATYELFLYWQPYSPYNAYEDSRSDYIFFDAVVGQTLSADSFHVAYQNSQVSVIDALALDQPKDVMTKPFEKCQLLRNGYVRLAPNPT